MIQNSIFFDNANQSATWPAESNDDGAFDEASYFGTTLTTNRFANPGLTASALYLISPDFRPGVGAPAATGAAVPPNDGFFDQTATYVGAMSSAGNWTAGWSLYPNN